MHAQRKKKRSYFLANLMLRTVHYSFRIRTRTKVCKFPRSRVELRKFATRSEIFRPGAPSRKNFPTQADVFRFSFHVFVVYTPYDEPWQIHSLAVRILRPVMERCKWGSHWRMVDPLDTIRAWPTVCIIHSYIWAAHTSVHRYRTRRHNGWRRRASVECLIHLINRTNRRSTTELQTALRIQLRFFPDWWTRVERYDVSVNLDFAVYRNSRYFTFVSQLPLSESDFFFFLSVL